ncbi:hypothetical protein PFISCL1PPCAC_7863, partial [Pristionchus fissidentatus]
IIDKHGWTSHSRITRTQYKGYIRTVAIRLIFYCRFNETTEEVTKFIGEGFEKLRYNAVEQYPHCGMLWAHVATCRNKIIQELFMCDIKKIAKGKWKEPMEIPESDRFPAIGNICEQAQAAMGGGLFWWGKNPAGSEMNSKKGLWLTPSIINGILRSSHLDMGVMMKALFSFENIDKLRDTVTMDQWYPFMDRAMRIMICYG